MTKTAEKTKKTAPKNKVEMTFIDWVKGVARARGEVGALVKTIREDAKFKGYAANTLKAYQKKFGSDIDALWARYEQFCRRGSQAGLRSRAAATA